MIEVSVLEFTSWSLLMFLVGYFAAGIILMKGK